jgi:hypothetical protein
MNETVSIHTAPLPYDTSYEVPEEDETATIDGMLESLRKIAETTLSHSGHATRAVHAKSHGIVRAGLRVLDGLPPELAQGIFARAGTWPAVMRFSTTPGDMLDDHVSTPRGLAIKIVGVEGVRLPGSENDVTQDFILINGPVFATAGRRNSSAV